MNILMKKEKLKIMQPENPNIKLVEIVGTAFNNSFIYSTYLQNNM